MLGVWGELKGPLLKPSRRPAAMLPVALSASSTSARLFFAKSVAWEREGHEGIILGVVEP